MPRGDGSGPSGMGPMTGRGAGYCAGIAAPRFANSWGGRGGGFRFGMGRGMGWGRGRGWGWQAAGPAVCAYPTTYPAAPASGWLGPQDQESQLSMLKNQADMLSESLANIQKQIETLEGQDQG
jgi:Family of unknown function (DUF5320)